MDQALMDEIAARSMAGPMFGRVAPPGQPIDLNIPFLQNNPALGILSQLAFSAFASNSGGVPAQFLPTQNLFDQYRSKAYWSQHSAALQGARQQDEKTYVQMLRGLSEMTGSKMGLEEERLAQSVAGDIGGIMPLLIQFAPELADSLHGSRGSAMAMAHFMHQGGRFGVDPTTGRVGLSGESAGQMAAQLQEQFFGPGADISRWQGFSAGRVGSLYDEAMRRGLMGVSVGAADDQMQMLSSDRSVVESVLSDMARDRPEMFNEISQQARRRMGGADFDALTTPEQVRHLAASEDVPMRAMEALQKADPSGFDAKLRMFDSNSVKNRLQNLVGVVGAMRDIMGDAGNPNAPMSQLLDGLQQLTQGGLASQSTASLNQSLRMTQSLATQTGIGLQAMMGLTAQAAADADRLGLDRSFAVPAAQGAAAFGAAFRDSGRGDITAWGRKSIEQLTLQDQQLRMRGAASTAGNQIGAAMRLADELGIEKGTTMSAMVDAIRNQQTEFVDPATGKSRSIYMDNAEWLTIASSAGIDDRTAMSVLHDKYTNQEYGFKYNAGDLARQLNTRDVQNWLAQATGEGVVTAATQNGAERDKALQVSRAVAADISRDIVSMTAETRRDPQRRNEAIAESIKRHMAAQGINITDRQAKTAAITTWGNFEEDLRTDPAKRWAESGQNALDLVDGTVMKRQGVQMQQARTEAQMRDALSGMGQVGPLARLSDLIQNPPDNATDAISQALNIQDRDSIMKVLSTTNVGQFSNVADREAFAAQAFEMVSLNSDYRTAASEKDPAVRAQKQEDIVRTVRALRTGGTAAEEEIARIVSGLPLGQGKDLRTVLESQDLDEGTRHRLAALRLAVDGGYDARASRVQPGGGARISTDDFRAAAEASSASLDAIRKKEPDAATSVDRFLQSGRMIDFLMNDETTLKSLGAGGFDLAERAQKGHRDLAVMASEKKVSVRDLLTSGDSAAQKLHEEIASSLRSLHERSKLAVEARPAMTQAEEQRMKALQLAERKSDEELNAEAILGLASSSGLEISKGDASELGKMIGSGPTATIRRHALKGLDPTVVQQATSEHAKTPADSLGREVMRAVVRDTVARDSVGSQSNPDERTVRPDTVRIAEGTKIKVELNGKTYDATFTGGVGHVPLAPGN